jgi:multicomponent Na+:H+ antiporter subunit C
MSIWVTYALAAIALIGLGVLGAFDARSHVVRKVIAINVMGSGVFLLLVASARRATTAIADPVPHALVLTGIVISISASALALALAQRLTDEPDRPDDDGV